MTTIDRVPGHSALRHALFALVLCASSHAAAQAHPGLFRVDEVDAAPAPGRVQSGTDWLVLGTAITPLEATQWSGAGGARLFVRFADPTCATQIALVAGHTVVMTHGEPTAPGQCTALIPTAAFHGAAPLAGAVTVDASHAGDRVTATFAAGRPTYTHGRDAEVVLTLRNAGPTLLHYTTSPLFAAFTFVVTRNGAPVAHRDGAMGGNGASGFTVLPAVAQERGLVGGQYDVDAPGHYIVQCSFRAQFAAPPSDGAEARAVVRVLTGTVSFDVR